MQFEEEPEDFMVRRSKIEKVGELIDKTNALMDIFGDVDNSEMVENTID